MFAYNKVSFSFPAGPRQLIIPVFLLLRALPFLRQCCEKDIPSGFHDRKIRIAERLCCKKINNPFAKIPFKSRTCPVRIKSQEFRVFRHLNGKCMNSASIPHIFHRCKRKFAIRTDAACRSRFQAGSGNWAQRSVQPEQIVPDFRSFRTVRCKRQRSGSKITRAPPSFT